MAIRTVTVVGAGTMGSGIAQVFAQAGYHVHMWDAAPGGLAKGLQRIEAFWASGVERGKTTPDQRRVWRGNLDTETSLREAVADSELVVEAVPEDLDLKKRLFRDLDEWAPPDSVLATNTSSLSIAAIASATKRPGRVLGMHFFNPVPLMRLLELIRHAGTSGDAMQQARATGERLGKTVIVARDSPGFATSRLGIVLGNEAMRMLEEGVATASDIDTAMRLGYGHPMGPLELSDVVGLDVRLSISDYLRRELDDERYAAPAIVRRLVARGELGKKTGKGLFDWSTGMPVERAL